MRAGALGLLGALLAGPALAQCAPDEVLFACRIAAKDVSLCSEGRDVVYRFGRPGAPELILRRDVLAVDYEPWAGVGRTIYESASIRNEGYVYEVFSAIDRMIEGPRDFDMSGGIVVRRGDEIVATLDCAPESIVAGLDGLFSLREAAGQCWSFDAFEWRACNGG